MSVLINREVLLQVLQHNEPVALAVNRAVGKTTGAVLSALGQSYLSPGEWVTVEDPDQTTALLRDRLAFEVRRVIHALDMRSIEVRTGPTFGGRVQIRNTFAERLA